MLDHNMRKQASRTNEAKTKTGRKRQHAGATIKHAADNMCVKFVCVKLVYVSVLCECV